jgi:CRP-like cAMP-binding protein
VSARAIAAPTAPDRGAAPVALLRVDTGLRSAIQPEERAFAERVVIVPRRELEPGPWSPATAADDSAHPFCVVLLDGILTHEVTLAGRCNAELFGPGDIVRPWSTRDSVLPCTARWTTSGATIAVLDERFLLAARRWPGLSTAIQERLAEQAERAAVRTAIVALPRVGQRVLAVFWQLAERWGVVRRDGVVIRLALTHSIIGQLVGAQRPTVSLALQELTDDGLLEGPAAAHGCSAMPRSTCSQATTRPCGPASTGPSTTGQGRSTTRSPGRTRPAISYRSTRTHVADPIEPDRALAPLARLVDAVQADLAAASRIASDGRLHTFAMFDGRPTPR